MRGGVIRTTLRIGTMERHNNKLQSGCLERKGFTLIEMLVSSAVMLIVIMGALTLYMKTNKVAVDQEAFSEIQHDIRIGTHFVTRAVRSAGVGLPPEFIRLYLEGTDNEDQGAEVNPDRLTIMGNIEDPLSLSVSNYQGSAVTLEVEDFSFEQYPYPDEYYDSKVVLILPNPDSGCLYGQVREITHVSHNATGSNEKLNFSPGLSVDFNPPGGLSGTCPESDDYDGGTVAFINVKEFWLDVTGNYSGLSAGVNGYIGNGEGGILYMTENGIHYPLAQNVENLQFQYNGDINDDDLLDGYMDWQNGVWTGDTVLISRISQVRVWVLGQTARPFVSKSGAPAANLHLYRRPLIANSPAAALDDNHRRFLLDSTVNVRNRTLNLYNFGIR